MSGKINKMLRRHQQAVFPHIHGDQKEAMLKRSKAKWDSLSRPDKERIRGLMLADIQLYGTDKTSKFAAAVPLHLP